MKKVKVGVIGVGTMGSHHARVLSKLPEAQLVGVMDQDLSRAEEVAQKHQTKPFSNALQLLKEVEAVVIASPTETHFEMGKLALEAGVKLLVEKPIALSLPEAEALVAAAKKKKIPLAVGHIERFNPAFEKLSALLSSEKILSIEAKRFSPYPERIKDMSAVLDMMLHDLDLTLSLCPLPLAKLDAFGEKIKSSRLDKAFARLKFKGGLQAEIEANRLYPEKVRIFSATCEGKTYETDLLKRTLKVHLPEATKELVVENHDQLEAELKDFLKKGAPRVSGEDGLEALKLALEIERLCQ